MNKITILQIGPNNLAEGLSMPSDCTWIYTDDLSTLSKEKIDLCFLDRNVCEQEARQLIQIVRAATLFIFDSLVLDESTTWLSQSRRAHFIKKSELQTFLNEQARYFFSHAYGEKYLPTNLSVSQNYKGEIFWNGFNGVTLEGDYGEAFHQVFYWRNTIPVFHGQTIEFWLEYEKDDSVEIELVIDAYTSGSICKKQAEWHFDEASLGHLVQIENKDRDCSIFVMLRAKGKGKLRLIALHDRYARNGWGNFLPGGQRVVTSKREEIFFYFDPMDMKPPLNVYFSGYKTQEGFEGYNMMRKFGSPFLLVSESRLEGGAFYLGDEEYEKALLDQIRSYLDQLGFTEQQCILSGLSMGTFGALYYGCKLRPYALLLGKPLASLGNIALDERLKRPGGFPTSLDVLNKNIGAIDADAIEKFNARYWDLFDQTNWENTKFIISYMIEDDYDNDAYTQLLDHIHNSHITIYGKGLHGRHNDNTYGIVAWYRKQYRKVLEEDFSRKLVEE